jgi:hypothetical protein
MKAGVAIGKIFGKIFLFMSIGFGFTHILVFSFFNGVASESFIDGFKSSFPDVVSEGFWLGLFFGISMSLVLGTWHFISIIRLAYGINKETLGVNHIRKIGFFLPYDDAFDLAIGSTKIICNCKVQINDRPTGKIIAKVGSNWKTWGDEITLLVHRLDEERSVIKIQSRPILSTQFIDYGKNLENVETIRSYLMNHGA